MSRWYKLNVVYQQILFVKFYNLVSKFQILGQANCLVKLFQFNMWFYKC